MRDKNKIASLGELMGEGFEHRTKFSMDDLPKLLGDKMPEITHDRVGKLRLINALHQRFGAGYGNIPGVRDILEHFEKEAHVASIVRMNRRK